MNLLLSYAYGRKPAWAPILEGVRENGGKTIVDSGAFTAANSGRAVTLEGYCHFLRSRSHLFDEYIALDVLGDKEKTLENYSRMVKLGLRPMGVVTIDMKAEESLAYLENNHRLCVAGGVMRGSASWLPHKISLINRLSEGTARIHGLGYTPSPLNPSLEIASVDSSSWVSASKFGDTCWWDAGSARVMSKMWSKVKEDGMPPSLAAVFRNSSIKEETLEEDPRRLARGMTSVLGYLSALAWVCRTAFLKRSQDCDFYFVATEPVHSIPILSAMRYGRRDGSMDVDAAIDSELALKRSLPDSADVIRRYAQKAFDNYRENIL